MIIYILIKLLMSYWLIVKKQWIKDQEKLFLFFDLIIVIIYLLLTYLKGFTLLIELLIFGIIIIIIILIYKGINYIEKNNQKILEKIKKYINISKQEKIKRFFIKPWVSKTIYYMIWMLPWNIGYWIYFWIQENGWYLRVWISSTRDIVLWKIFKWDSRDYFYNLFEKLRKLLYNLKYYLVIRVQAMIYRIMYFIYIIRDMIIKTSIKKYIWIRIIVYMYLSMFYLYILMEIQIINKILFYLLIIIELLFLYFTKEIIEYYENEFIYINQEAGKITEETIWIINFLKYPFNVPYMNKWVKNKFIWDKTLGNSISLNILYKYIIFVNKNTKGYFDRQMNIMTRIYREKYLERKSILWDVLPRTRYVIISLKNEGFYRSEIKGLEPDFSWTKCKHINLINNRNLYLGYYEKTYSETSLLMLIWILRVNKFFWTLNYIYIYNDEDIDKFFKLRSFSSNDSAFSLYLYIIIFIYIYKSDKRLINEECLFSYFLNRHINFYNEEIYFYGFGSHIYENKNKLKIVDKICGIKNYKKMFKIMGRIMLYEEDNIIWNNNLQQLLNEFYIIKDSNNIIKEKYENFFEEKLKNIDNNSCYLNDKMFNSLKEKIKLFIETNNDEIFDSEDFKYFFILLMLKDNSEEFKIIKTWCDGKDIEEILDKILCQIIRKNISFSEHKFYDSKKGNNYFFENFSYNPDEIEEEKIKDYKK